MAKKVDDTQLLIKIQEAVNAAQAAQPGFKERESRARTTLENVERFLKNDKLPIYCMEEPALINGNGYRLDWDGKTLRALAYGSDGPEVVARKNFSSILAVGLFESLPEFLLGMVKLVKLMKGPVIQPLPSLTGAGAPAKRRATPRKRR